MLPGGTTMFQEIDGALLGARGFEVFLCFALGSHLVTRARQIRCYENKGHP